MHALTSRAPKVESRNSTSDTRGGGRVVVGEALELVIVLALILLNLVLLVLIQRWSGLT